MKKRHEKSVFPLQNLIYKKKALLVIFQTQYIKLLNRYIVRGDMIWVCTTKKKNQYAL